MGKGLVRGEGKRGEGKTAKSGAGEENEGANAGIVRMAYRRGGRAEEKGGKEKRAGRRGARQGFGAVFCAVFLLLLFL